jgi:hypothetical protein
MTSPKPFAQPWRAVEHSESFEVQSAEGRTLTFICFEDLEGRRSVMKCLSREDARRRTQ